MIDRKDRIVKNESAGFTLVELMIALVVIAIGVMALSGVQTRSSRDVYATGRPDALAFRAGAHRDQAPVDTPRR